MRTSQSGWAKAIPSGGRKPGTLSPDVYNEEHVLAAEHIGAHQSTHIGASTFWDQVPGSWTWPRYSL